MARFNFKKVFDMTVTSFLLLLLTFIGGCALGAALYQWHLIRKIKSAIKSLIDEAESSIDFHQIELKDGKKLTVSESLLFDDKYVVTFEDSNNPFGSCGVCYFDKNTLYATTCGSN
jgi:hypothetical protein